MDNDELAFSTPPSKRRRLIAVKPTPPRLSDLLVAFGAQRTPSSVTKMQRHLAGHDMRAKPTINYAESDTTPDTSPRSASSFEDPQSSRTSMLPESEETSADELQSEDAIHVAPRRNGTRELPDRSTRTRVSYGRPKRAVTKSKSKKKATKMLISDTAKPAAMVMDTARARIRREILESTKPRRDVFLLANKDYFLSLLPEKSNYILRLERTATADATVSSYATLATQPRGVKAIMKPYQLQGLSFLVHMYVNGMSCLLGDEMGLGKTLQTLSLFQYLNENDPVTGENRPYLVVCPLSVLSSWIKEARQWTPELHVIRFHGPTAERDKLKKDLLQQGANVDLVVTTYETFKAEASWFKRAFAWRYCVLDEGHKIKNEKTGMASALQSLQAEYRLLLTGTPLQNNLREMWALLHWLLPDVFTDDTADTFKQAFDLTKGKVSTSFMDDARSLLELLMLRRMKSSPGVDLGLPRKEEVILYTPLTPVQRFWYTRMLTMSDTAVVDDLFSNAKSKETNAYSDSFKQLAHEPDASHLENDVWTESKDLIRQALDQEQQSDVGSGKWKRLQNLVMQLRRICIHPYNLSAALPTPYVRGEHIKLASGKFIVLDKLIEEIVMKRKKKVLIFSQFTGTLDLCEDLLALRGANMYGAPFRYLRLDGSVPRAKRNLGLRMFNDMKSEVAVMLISTKAGGLGLNLASATSVIFLDEDWNPQITLQAEARAHRIGQTQPVTVYKICTQGTVEQQMMSRIQKKLYLSAKITESMRNIHGEEASAGRKRKRDSEIDDDDETTKMGTNQLSSLLRKGAQVLVRPELDVTEMLDWDFETMLEQCKDKPAAASCNSTDAAISESEEQAWLNAMEKVECAVFEGRKHQREVDPKTAIALDLDRADRRIGKNTTVMVDGYEINKESMQCADWEAVPTFAGKDPRLAEPVRAKKAATEHQGHCQHCWDGGELVLCNGCPRSYHFNCLDKEDRVRARGFNFNCPQHHCHDCGAKTANAGGLIFRCRFCEHGYCEDCLDWDVANLVGETLPELEMLGFDAVPQAWFIDCPKCVEYWKSTPADLKIIQRERARIEKEYEKFLDG